MKLYFDMMKEHYNRENIICESPDDKVLGFMIYSPISEDSAYIDNIYVGQQHRKDRIAKNLVKMLVAKGFTKLMSHVDMTSAVAHDAIKFHLAMGAEIHEASKTRIIFYKDYQEEEI